MAGPGDDARLVVTILAVALGAARATPIVWMVAPLGGPRLPTPVRAEPRLSVPRDLPDIAP